MENMQTITINSVKEFKELAKNKDIHEACIEYKCQQCGRIHKIHKAYGKGTKSDNHYYRMLKWEDDHSLICPWCFSSNNFKETQNRKSEKTLQETQAKRWKTRRKNISTQAEEDSKVEYTSFEDVEAAFNNGAKGATVICPDCGEKKVIKGRQNLYHFIRNGNINHDLRCRGCAITKGKIEASAKKITKDPTKLFNCEFVDGQEYVGAGYEDKNGNNVKREFRPKYQFRCKVCGNIFEDSFPCGSESLIKCPDCYPDIEEDPVTTTSNVELDMWRFIEEICEEKYQVKRNVRDIIPPSELDIYIPELKIAFEYDGVYWHSDTFKDNNYHLNKTLECEEKGIRLIHIFEDEWKYSPDKTRSFIRVVLGFYDIEIGLKDCSYRMITSRKEVKEFFEENDIKEVKSFNLAYGCYCNGILVSAISCIRINDNLWKIVNFANRKNYKVKESFSHFMRQLPETDILLTLDRSKFDKNCFPEGFELIEIYKPNYFYSKQNYRLKQSEVNKEILSYKENHPECSDMSNDSIMNNLGYKKIYNSGEFVLINHCDG